MPAPCSFRANPAVTHQPHSHQHALDRINFASIFSPLRELQVTCMFFLSHFANEKREREAPEFLYHAGDH